MAHSLRISLTLISLLIAVTISQDRLVSMAAPGDEGDPWKQMIGYLFILRTGEPGQKRYFAGEASLRLAPLFGLHKGHDEEEVQVILDEVRDLVRLEKDDFVSWNVLNDLSSRNDMRLTVLFLDALRDVSPNLRWAGIKWFSENASSEAVQDLEFAWRQEERAWVRIDLMAALARQGRAGHLEEFISIARGEDPDLSEAAIEALSVLRDSRAVPAIVSLTGDGNPTRRGAALDALSSWPGSVDALEALLAASRSEDPSLKARAVGSLGSFAAPGASARLEEVILEEGDPWLRSRAIEALGKSDPARTVPLLVRVLHETTGEDGTRMKESATSALMEIDNPAILDSVSDLDPAADPWLEFDLRVMLQSLGRDRRTQWKSVIVRDYCPRSRIVTDPADPAMRTILPVPWLQSVRCWETPGFAGDPEDFRRLQGGTPVRIEAHFEWERKPWVLVTNAESHECWVPLEFVGQPSGPPEGADREADMMMRREFDLPAVEVESDVAQGLMDAGLLEVIEPGDGVIGVAIHIDPEDFDGILLLARSCGQNETMLDGEIYEIVSDLAPLYRGHPELDRFRRTPVSVQGETDDVIDLEIEELTDR